MNNTRKQLVSKTASKSIEFIKALHPRNFFHFVYKDKTLIIKYFSLADRVSLLEQRLLNEITEYNNHQSYIKHVLSEVQKPLSGCGYIIFQIGKNRRQFVQFSIRGKGLVLDFPFFPGNDHVANMQKTRKLLETLGLTFIDGEIYPMRYTYLQCTPKNADPFSTLIADFDSNTDITSEFIYRVFTEIFQKDTSKLHIEMGTGRSKLLESMRLGKEILKQLFSRSANK